MSGDNQDGSHHPDCRATAIAATPSSTSERPAANSASRSGTTSAPGSASPAPRWCRVSPNSSDAAASPPDKRRRPGFCPGYRSHTQLVDQLGLLRRLKWPKSSLSNCPVSGVHLTRPAVLAGWIPRFPGPSQSFPRGHTALQMGTSPDRAPRRQAKTLFPMAVSESSLLRLRDA